MKRIDCDVKIKHLTRVEGHGNIVIRVKDGRVRAARWEVVESPRFFEALLTGKRYENAPYICGRICGICSIGHTLASVRAVERAFGMEIPRPIQLLRLLLKHMETLQSHVLHLFFLAAPDFLGAPSVLPLLESRPAIVETALRLKQLANDGADILGGRRIHPPRVVVGGFTMLPAREELQGLWQRLEQAEEDLKRMVAFFVGLEVPPFERPALLVSLAGGERYPFIGGRITTSEGTVGEEDGYEAFIQEYPVKRSTAKWCKVSGKSFAVGALARLHNNFTLLHPAAQEAAQELKVAERCANPLYNNHAQVVECVHVAHESRELIRQILDEFPQEPRIPVTPRAGSGVGAVEVPRGTLYHAYTFDGEGRIQKADCVIPTNQNHARIDQDLKLLARRCASTGMADREIEKLAAMLVRAYDPCISCSVH